MPAEVIQARYETLTNIAGRFGRQAEQSSQYAVRVRERMVALQNGGRQGRGAQAFFAEMENEVLPVVGRLSTALSEAQTVTLHIIEILREAEKDAAQLFGESSDRLNADGVVDRSADTSADELPVWDFPTLGKDILAIWDITSDISAKMGLFGPLFGSIFETWDNPDSDWIKSIISSAIQEFGAYSIGLAQPELAIAKSVNDISQLLGRVGHAMDRWKMRSIIADHGIRAGMLAETEQFYENIERLDMDHAIEPLADMVYDYSVAPYIHAVEDVWRQPDLENMARLTILPILGLSGLGMPIIDSRARQDIGTDVEHLKEGSWEIGTGVVNLPKTIMEYESVKVVGGAATDIDLMPIPATWKESIEGSAGTYIHRMNTL